MTREELEYKVKKLERKVSQVFKYMDSNLGHLAEWKPSPLRKNDSVVGIVRVVRRRGKDRVEYLVGNRWVKTKPKDSGDILRKPKMIKAQYGRHPKAERADTYALLKELVDLGVMSKKTMDEKIGKPSRRRSRKAAK